MTDEKCGRDGGWGVITGDKPGGGAKPAARRLGRTKVTSPLGFGSRNTGGAGIAIGCSEPRRGLGMGKPGGAGREWVAAALARLALMMAGATQPAL